MQSLLVFTNDHVPKPMQVTGRNIQLSGTDYDKIVSNVSELLDSPSSYERMSKAVNPYGDGKACGRIVEALK